jgi:hypothetical protein
MIGLAWLDGGGWFTCVSRSKSPLFVPLLLEGGQLWSTFRIRVDFGRAVSGRLQLPRKMNVLEHLCPRLESF